MKLSKPVAKAWDRTRDFTQPDSDAVVVRYCDIADDDHDQDSRVFMHTGHSPSVICVAKAAGRLSLENLCGLFSHEMGHIIQYEEGLDVTEDGADEIVYDRFGIEIEYDNQTVQWADLHDDVEID